VVCLAAIGCHKNRSLDEALRNAKATHKSLMVQFGADWCSDCQALSRKLQQEPFRNCLNKNVDMFKVDVGEFNRNLDIGRAVGIDIKNVVIPTAVFIPPQTTKIGTDQILSFLKQSCPGN
jgi:thioredoxin